MIRIDKFCSHVFRSLMFCHLAKVLVECQQNGGILEAASEIVLPSHIAHDHLFQGWPCFNLFC